MSASKACISLLAWAWLVTSSRWYRLLGSVTLPPAKNAPRRKAARQQSSSSRPKLMCSTGLCRESKPKASIIRWIFPPSVSWKIYFRSPSPGRRSNSIWKADSSKLGRRAAKLSLSVISRTSREVKVLPYSSAP